MLFTGTFCVRAMTLFFFSSRRPHTRCGRDWSSDVCSSDLAEELPKVTPPSTTSVTSGNYHIIVGAFSDENNAQTLVDELQGMGFNSASIIGQFTSQNLHYVAAGSYSSMADAQSALSQVKTQKSNAWIFKR